MLQLIILIVLLAWLMVCMVYDLRFREVPNKLTLIPLIAAGVYALFQGWWAPVLLTASLIHFSDFEPREKRLAFAFVFAAFAAIFQPLLWIQVIALLITWLLWEFGAMGGADAKLLMVIALVVGHPIIFMFIALAGGIQGMAALVLRKKNVPYIVAIFAGASLYAVNSIVLRIL